MKTRLFMRALVVLLVAMFFCHQAQSSPLMMKKEVVGETTTAPNWSVICADLCKQGNGGALCNCELIPFRRGIS